MPKTNNAVQEVRVGQVWADNDPRMSHRWVRVEALTGSRGGHEVLPGETPKYGRCVAGTLTRFGFQPWSGDRFVWIRLDRFRPTSTGFRLVSDAPENP